MRRSPTTRLGVQQLEARDVPSVTSVASGFGVVQILSDNTNSNVTITKAPGENWVHVTDTTNGFNKWCTDPTGPISHVYYHGGSASDTVDGSGAYVPLT